MPFYNYITKQWIYGLRLSAVNKSPSLLRRPTHLALLLPRNDGLWVIIERKYCGNTASGMITRIRIFLAVGQWVVGRYAFELPVEIG
jgi:hypothetical protein